MTKKLLTVNIVTYNHQKYIAKCLDSILEQKTNFDFVVRIFDDCSNDGTSEICKDYQKKFPDKIEYHAPSEHIGYKNGILINCVKAYENIQTPYYMYIEGDDYRLDVDGFQKQIDALEEHPECAFCMGNTINYRNNKFSDIHPNIPSGIYDREFMKKYPERYIFSNLAARIVRTSCIKMDYANPIYLFDITQFYELMKQGGMYFINEVFACYNVTGNGISTSTNLFGKIVRNAQIFNDYNVYSNKIFEQNLAIYYIQDIYGYYLWELEKLAELRKDSNEHKQKQNIIKKLKHYFLPQAIIDLFNLPRNISRQIRSAFRKDKSLLWKKFLS